MTFTIEIFGYQVGTAGLTEGVAREKGLDVVCATSTTPSTRPKYGGKPVHSKLIADRQTGTLVGAQIISEEMIRGVVNEMALAIAEKVPLGRLALLETPYSPAVGMDPIEGGIMRLIRKLG